MIIVLTCFFLQGLHMQHSFRIYLVWHRRELIIIWGSDVMGGQVMTLGQLVLDVVSDHHENELETTLQFKKVLGLNSILCVVTRIKSSQISQEYAPSLQFSVYCGYYVWIYGSLAALWYHVSNRPMHLMTSFHPQINVAVKLDSLLGLIQTISIVAILYSSTYW